MDSEACSTCKSAFQAAIQKDHNAQLHHQQFDDLVASKERGCIMCTWLWNEYIMQNGVTQQSDTKGFHVTSTKHEHEECISFRVVVPGVADFTLQVSIKSQPEVSQVLTSKPWESFDVSTGSDQSISRVELWLSHCDRTHKFCRDHDSTLFFPTRVIDVNEIESGKVHLRDRQEVIAQEGLQTNAGTHTSEEFQGHFPVYWTLSHRWGDPEKILKLLHANEDQFKRGLSLATGSVPKTFQDAMWTIHRLKHRYIWIDSFCIFQDSIEDWQREADKVSHIYRNSFCNISAILSSYEPTSTLFTGERSPRLLFPFSVKLFADGQQTYIVKKKSLWKDEIERSPLSTRGWVVQERFLAPRIIHFARNQVFWECLENARCEADPDNQIGIIGDPDINHESPSVTAYKDALKELAKLTSFFLTSSLDRTKIDWNRDSVGQHSFYTERVLWRQMISIYTACNLSNQSDRLIAMAGIAKAFQKVTLSTYLAGLWKHSLHTDLLWESNASEGGAVHRNTLHVPSWSWASVFGGNVRLYGYTRFGGDPASQIEYITSRLEAERPGGDLMGLLGRAELEIECVLLYYRWKGSSQSLELFVDEPRTQLAFNGGRVWGANLKLDTHELVQVFKEKVFIEGECIPIAVGREAYGASVNRFLVVEKVPEGKYRRLGVYQLREQGASSVIGNKERTAITLV
ncbi:heterokaryon incompatibility protein-domain-containing protein [Penicillium sp. IBT 35674x]|nr:heterokaryon incompatibility protein-domain-containing protein [Penicillium sp. IBT 35674x]